MLFSVGKNNYIYNPSLRLAARQVDHCLQLVADLVLASSRVAYGSCVKIGPVQNLWKVRGGFGGNPREKKVRTWILVKRMKFIKCSVLLWAYTRFYHPIKCTYDI